MLFGASDVIGQAEVRSPTAMRRLLEPHFDLYSLIGEFRHILQNVCTRRVDLRVPGKLWLSETAQAETASERRFRYARKKPTGTMKTVTITDSVKPPISARANGAYD